QDHKSLHVVIVGAELGGLTCALACRQGNLLLAVTILERAPDMLPVGAGIQLPPNATRIISHLGLLEKMKESGAITMEQYTLRRYSDGRVVVEKPLGDRMREIYGAEWLVIHRAEYQNLLLEEALNAGACLLKNAEVVGVGSESNAGVTAEAALRKAADIIIGADGSKPLSNILIQPSPPSETGDLAYRGTFSREQLMSFQDERILELVEASKIQVWMGPNQHVVFYPVRNKTEYNLVLIKVLEEMTDNFKGWDPAYVCIAKVNSSSTKLNRLTRMISCLKTALKWKLCHYKELDRWTKNTIALLGDASHPTLPYQAQGAAMAVEDGAVIGLLLAKLLNRRLLALDLSERNSQMASLLKLYESLRKERTETNVLGAVQSQEFYHLSDGEIQIERD
ncbi:putative salicylate hydroxylase, partial [Xylogone sp. PMI_703]